MEEAIQDKMEAELLSGITRIMQCRSLVLVMSYRSNQQKDSILAWFQTLLWVKSSQAQVLRVYIRVYVLEAELRICLQG